MKTLNLSIPGLTIACKIWGDSHKPPVLALHGWLDNANSFDPLAEYLQEHFYFIAVDLPGHGHSSHLPLCSHYHFMDAIFYVIEIMDALKLEKVHLLGHSLGACIASIVGGVAAKRFLSLSLIEGLGPFSYPEDTACKQLSEYLHFLEQCTAKSVKGYPEIDIAAKARARKGYVSFEIAQKLVERALKEEQGTYYWRHDNRLMVPSPLRMTENQILSCLDAIKAKTCLIWASEGFSYNSEIMQQRINSVHDLVLERLPGGHHIHMEQPEPLAQLLTAFFKSTQP